MTVKWSSVILNDIAPGLASFSRAEIPDLTTEFPQAPHWIPNYFLNTIFRGRFVDRVRQAVLGYLRRADRAFRAYHDARRRTVEYVTTFEPGRPKLRLYYDAVADWENFTLQVQMATDLYVFISNSRAFEPGDGSPEQRLYDLANVVKHFRGHLSSRKFSREDVLPLWIDSEGLRSFKLTVTYQEAAGLLRDVSSLANLLQDPRSIVEDTGGKPSNSEPPAP